MQTWFPGEELESECRCTNSDEPLTLDLVVFRYFKTKKEKKFFLKCLAKCIWSPISQLSVVAAICSAHLTPCNCLEWIPLTDQFQTELMKGGETISTRHPLRSLHLTCRFLTVEAWTVERVTEMHHGIFTFTMHLHNAWSLTLCC